MQVTGQNATTKNNPLLMDWNTPHQTPPFDLIRAEHYIPAFEEAIKIAKEEVQQIAQQKAEPTFENTIVALETSGSLLNRTSGVFHNLIYAVSTPELQEIAQVVNPMITKYNNDIYLNPALFVRVKKVYDNPGQLTKEQKMLLDKTYRAFVRSGANLSDADKEKFRAITTELSPLSLQFAQNVMKSTNSWFKHITDVNELQGIQKSDLELAVDRAKKKNLEGWVFDLSVPSYNAIMKYADNRKLREEFYIKYNAKAYKDEFDNSDLIKKILTLRYDLATLLGFNNYAEYALQERMAENSENVYNLLDELLKYSLQTGQKEMRELNQYASANGLVGPVQRWDFTYYSEKQKSELYDLSDNILKPYFKLENVIKGVFLLADTLFDIQFVPAPNIQVYHPEVKAYEAYREGKFLAVLYLDFHPRESKKSGAWMTSFREQYIDGNGKDVRPIVSLVMNFTPSTPTQPALLTFSEVSTFLHEFGHAMHGMLSKVTYENLSGTNVPRDFVELPSQLLQNWVTQQDFLNTFAVHYETGEIIPQELIQKLQDYNNFMAGYTSCRQLSFGYLDMMWHTMNPKDIDDIWRIERTSLDKTELMPIVPGTCMSSSFNHIFSGGYAAGYYSYKWSEVLDADAFSFFQEKGIFNKEVANSYLHNILEKGGSEKAADLYVNFRGRQPQIDALLKRSKLK